MVRNLPDECISQFYVAVTRYTRKSAARRTDLFWIIVSVHDHLGVGRWRILGTGEQRVSTTSQYCQLGTMPSVHELLGDRPAAHYKMTITVSLSEMGRQA